jgi:hypothetical protein
VNSIIENEMLEILFKDFKNSKYYTEALLGLEIRRALQKFLFNENDKEKNEIIIKLLIPFFKTDVVEQNENMKMKNNLPICSHATNDCEFKSCDILLKNYVFCLKK